jgi:hypothetical protein
VVLLEGFGYQEAGRRGYCRIGVGVRRRRAAKSEKDEGILLNADGRKGFC